MPSWQSFARPYLFVLIPNVLWLGGCFFVLAALTRQMAPVYVAGVVTLVGYLFAVNLLGDMENKTLAALIDPSGATAVDVLTRYWSVAQKNGEQIALAGPLLWNRVLWIALGAVVTLLGYRAFRMQSVAAFAQAPQGARRRGRGRGRHAFVGAAARCRARSQRPRLRAHAARAWPGSTSARS